MFVSKKQSGGPAAAAADLCGAGPAVLDNQEVIAVPAAESLTWLRRELEWEAVLHRLRLAAGVAVPAGVDGKAAVAA